MHTGQNEREKKGRGIAMRVYERCGMSTCANGVNCGMVEWVKGNLLKWSGHFERIGSEEFVKVFVKVYEVNLRVLIGEEDHLEDGRIRWRTWERGINGRGLLEQARRECWDRDRWRLLCCGHPLGEHSWM